MQQAYALFDFDGTLIKGDSIVQFCLYAAKHKLCSPFHLIKAAALGLGYQLRLVSAENSKQGALSFLIGKDSAEVDKIARAFASEVLIPKLNPDGVARIQRHQKEGAKVWMISASPAFYLEPVKEHLKLDGLIGTRMHVDENGRYTGLIDGHNCRGVEKTLRLAEVLAAGDSMVDYTESWAYGDSAGDVPMLMLCQHKIAVNPSRKMLRALVKESGVDSVCWG